MLDCIVPLSGATSSHCNIVLAQEILTALLMQPVAQLHGRKMCDITVGDILGPLKKKQEAGNGTDKAVDRARDVSFSLLSYSFSLVGPAASILKHKQSGDTSCSIGWNASTLSPAVLPEPIPSL